MADPTLRRTTTCLGCDAVMPNAALDALLCRDCLDEATQDELAPWLQAEGPASPRGPGPEDSFGAGPGPDDEHAGDLT
jgi:hypothetical protein